MEDYCNNEKKIGKLSTLTFLHTAYLQGNTKILFNQSFEDWESYY